MSRTVGKNRDQYKVLSGTCPDEECKAKLYFPAFDKSIECTNCGQRHDRASIQNVDEVTNANIALHNLLKNVLLGNVKPQKGPENIKVLGLSNYVCKLLSPILTKYGMDKHSGRAKLLPNDFDCAVLGDRAFLIDPEHLSVMGYGQDRSGSKIYLADTLNIIKDVNDNEEYLVPVHADGDGHCLVHAVSRALVGRELFWHPLRVNLLHHFKKHVDKYKALFRDFIDQDEWKDIINECDPDFIPPDYEPLGLRNIHIFGLANVLKRPIILLDSLGGMQSSGDYSGVFLPALVDPEECKKDRVLNKPLCVAWSSSGRNHFIPLVGIRGKPVPKLGRYMIQRAWGIPDVQIDKYIDFDDNGHCRIGGDKFLQDRYIQKLVQAMEEVFKENHGVHPSIVADVHQYVYKQSGVVNVRSDTVIAATKKAIQERRLYRCLMCDAVTEYKLPAEWFVRGGSLYNMAVQVHGQLQHNMKYNFPTYGATCQYDQPTDQLLLDAASSKLTMCSFCQGDRVRKVNGDCTVLYQNGDRTLTTSNSTRCTCGYKHYWNGKEYDNFPELLPVRLDWNDRVIKEEVAWFQYEQDFTLNSNVYQVAQELVQKHFPGEFGSERLVQKVVDKLLRLTAKPESQKEAGKTPPAPKTDNVWSPDSPSKIIITGQQHKSVHKEELTKSQTERMIRQRIESNAPKQQRKSSDPSKQSAASPGQSPRRSTPEKKVPTPTTTAGLASSPTEPPAVTPPPQTGKKIRIASSDGRQEMLNLEGEITLSQLQDQISDKLGIPMEKQRLRVGFPPRELKAGSAGDDTPVALQHGDKVAVEIVSTAHHATASQRSSACEPVSSPTHTQKTWSKFDENITAQSAEALLESLKNTQSGHADSIDMSITNMAMLAQLSGRDLWSYVSTQPHLFSVGGLFYKQVERDLGLAPAKHCTLPALPGKVFRFNADADRLEICLEPYGHFPVEPDIERKVTSAAPVDEEAKVSFGSSGAIGKGDKGHVAFSGHGHSLRSGEDTRMPTDLPESPRKHHARRITNLCDPTHHAESISEDPEELPGQPGGDKPNQAVKVDYQKRGPGFSVLDPTASNTTNANLDEFRQLTEALEKSVADCNEFEESSLGTGSNTTSPTAPTSRTEGFPGDNNTPTYQADEGSSSNKEEKMDTT